MAKFTYNRELTPEEAMLMPHVEAEVNAAGLHATPAYIAALINPAGIAVDGIPLTEAQAAEVSGLHSAGADLEQAVTLALGGQDQGEADFVAAWTAGCEDSGQGCG